MPIGHPIMQFLHNAPNDKAAHAHFVCWLARSIVQSRQAARAPF
jgi:hypothetical protein